MFQFHTGSIKSQIPAFLSRNSKLFQFHTGSIKRPHTRQRRLDLSSFNSILVRLKVPPMRRRCKKFLKCFNSILVRLKADTRMSPRRRSTCFNSILVRLKGVSSGTTMSSWREFQFHTGSIKSHPHPSLSKYVDKFQFHTGSIKSRARHPSRARRYLFQFHTGSIKSVIAFGEIEGNTYVSIPYWFD